MPQPENPSRRPCGVSDQYWELWFQANTEKFFPMCAGVVSHADALIVHLVGGAWRFASEGFAFTSRAEALEFCLAHAI
ncbi:MAG: hypothetical protein EOO73_11770 [Myxococcales bacterium]|nr:MAG: hypothetical protein EOO73_11770 [Myxococcales bacterium]